MTRTVTTETPASVNFLFNAGDQDTYCMLDIPHYTSASYVYPINGYKVATGGGTESSVYATFTSSNCPTLTATSTLWVQVQFDGTTLSVKELAGSSAPTSSAWSSAGVCYSSTAFSNTGGMIGFKAHEAYPSADIEISQITVNSYDTATSAFDITEHFDNFSVNSSTGVATNTLASDSNGNQTYDGTNIYTYDAWNRLMSVSHGYRDASNNLQHGHVFETITYDARGRRVTKSINGTGQWDCPYNYYLDKDSVVEERNGSNQTIKQYLWGITYIDELVQTSLNSSPSTQSTCDTPYWAMQDSNFNNLGVVNSSGDLTERYEYTPYGQRIVYMASGSNDVGDFASSVASQRFAVSSTAQPWGICPIGHQGLMHDEEAGNVNARNRELDLTLARWDERDPIESSSIALALNKQPLSPQLSMQLATGIRDAALPSNPNTVAFFGWPKVRTRSTRSAATNLYQAYRSSPIDMTDWNSMYPVGGGQTGRIISVPLIDTACPAPAPSPPTTPCSDELFIFWAVTFSQAPCGIGCTPPRCFNMQLWHCDPNSAINILNPPGQLDWDPVGNVASSGCSCCKNTGSISN
jgi:hypothetical protein